MKACMNYIKRHLIIFLGVLTAALMAVNCGALGKGAGSTLTEAEVAAITKRMAPNLAAAGAEPELPRVFLNTDYVPPTGRTIVVGAGGDFQAAINEAQPGDIITLQAGVSYTGNFTLPAKTGNGWIVIRTSAPDSSLPAPGTRMTPAYAGLLPKLVTPNSNPALEAMDGAHHYRIIGVEFAQASGVELTFNLVAFGDVQNTLDRMPHNLILDRVYIHGNPTAKLRRGVRLNCATSAVIDSYISDCKDIGFDSQAIGSWNGPGPFKIVNNYLEGAGENIIFGGGDPQITNLVPSDIEFRRNHCYKPLKWRQEDPSYAGLPWSVKNLLELKNAQRVLIDGNIFENNWTNAQNGYAVLFTVRNQDGTAPWSAVQDITFTNNIVRKSGAGINMHGTDNLQPSITSRRIRISNNLFVEIDGRRWDGPGIGFQWIGGPHESTVEHNTILHSGNIIATSGVPTEALVFRNNLFHHNEYGVVGDNYGTGNSAINFYFPSSVFVKNVLVGGASAVYPADNFFPTSFEEVKFVDQVGGNYRLAANSPYKNAGTDGKDIGCDFDALEAALVRNISTAFSVSAASYSANAPLAAESIVSAFGTGLATGTQAATTTPLPTTLAGTTVKVRDSAGVERQASLFYVSPTQVNYQIPAGTANGTAIVTMTSGTTIVATGTVQITNVSPGLFSFEATGSGVAAGESTRFRNGVQQSETRLARFDATQNKWIPIPVDLSFTTDQVFLILYGTGIRARNPNGTVTAQVGGVACQVTYAGVQSTNVGLDQVNILLVNSLAGRGVVDLVLNIDGVAANTVQVTIQ
jgi:uncharacterized protein (TIGR03437 family)